MRRHHFSLIRIFWLVVICLPILLADNPSSATIKAKSKGEVIELNEENWDQALTGEWMIVFHAPWCPACRDFRPEFRKFAEWDRDLGFKAGTVDVQAHPALSGRFLISALPTIYYVKNGVFRQYTGVRDRERMMRFLENKEWEKVEPVNSWLHPGAPQMGLVGKFFKLSMHLKNLHTWMVEDQQIPNWLTYVIFAMGTIALGGAIGVILVLVIEFFTVKRKDPAPKQCTEGKIITNKEKRSSRSGSSRSPSASHSGSEAETDVGTQSGGENVSSGSGSDLEGTDEEPTKNTPPAPTAKSRPGKQSPDEAEQSDPQMRRRRARRED